VAGLHENETQAFGRFMPIECCGRTRHATSGSFWRSPHRWPAWVGRALLLAASLVGVVSLARSQDADAREERSAERDEPHLNLTSPTLGGKQFWTDELVFHDWRVQRNVLTNHSRLLDDKDLRRAWGSFEECREQLESLKRQLPLRPMRRHAVIVLHGLGRTRQSMAKMCTYLQDIRRTRSST